MGTNKGNSKVRAAVLCAGAAVVLVLAGACSSGVAQKDFDAAKTQLTAKEAEVASLQQRLTSKEQELAKLQPKAPREPKRLESKIAIVMGEDKDGMYLANADGVKGGPFRLPAGKTVGIHLINKGVKDHEVLFGRSPKMTSGKAEDYQVNLFKTVGADIFVYPSGNQVEVATGGELEEVEVAAGADAWMRMSFPAEMKGEWEVACFVAEPGQVGHYEQGMKAKFIIE